MERERKTETGCLKRIDIRTLNQEGVFDGWNTATATWQDATGRETVSTVTFMPGKANVSLSHGFLNLPEQSITYPVLLETTPCHFGGTRYWFACPLKKNGAACNRRVAVLYLRDKYFGCRHCYNLTYASKNENRRSRFYPFFKAFQLDDRIEKLLLSIKRENYAGRETRKQRRLVSLRRMYLQYSFSALKNDV